MSRGLRILGNYPGSFSRLLTRDASRRMLKTHCAMPIDRQLTPHPADLSVEERPHATPEPTLRSSFVGVPETRPRLLSEQFRARLESGEFSLRPPAKCDEASASVAS